jgi:hypothetical protein
LSNIHLEPKISGLRFNFFERTGEATGTSTENLLTKQKVIKEITRAREKQGS